MNWLAKHDAVNVADILPCTEVEGPGKRFAIWVQGCPQRCVGCCNPEMQEFEEKSWVSVSDLIGQIRKHEDEIEGITLVGGEPVCQYPALGKLALSIQTMTDLGVMLFTGFKLEDLQKIAKEDLEMERFLDHIDLVIDGVFIEKNKSEKRRYVGSDNQRIHFLSDRYRKYENCWPDGDGAIEIRFDGKEIIINGHPRPTML